IEAQPFHQILADPELVEVLQVRQTLEQQDALDQPVGVLHLLDRGLVLVLRHPFEAPVLPHAGMEEVLVDRGELVLQHLVEVLDDLAITLHRILPWPMPTEALSTLSWRGASVTLRAQKGPGDPRLRTAVGLL